MRTPGFGLGNVFSVHIAGCSAEEPLPSPPHPRGGSKITTNPGCTADGDLAAASRLRRPGLRCETALR